MIENIITWVLVKSDGIIYESWSNAKEKPPCGQPGIYEWVEWNKPLPDDIDREEGYTLEELEELYAEMD